MFPGELTQAFAFRAEHKREREGQRRGLERLGTFLGEADPQEACLCLTE